MNSARFKTQSLVLTVIAGTLCLASFVTPLSSQADIYSDLERAQTQVQNNPQSFDFKIQLESILLRLLNELEMSPPAILDLIQKKCNDRISFSHTIQGIDSKNKTLAVKAILESIALLCPNGESLDLSGNALEKLPKLNWPLTFRRVDLRENFIDYPGTDNYPEIFPNVEHLNLSNSGFERIPSSWKEWSSLKNLRMDNCHIVDFSPLEKLNLTSLSLDGNDLKNIPGRLANVIIKQIRNKRSGIGRNNLSFDSAAEALLKAELLNYLSQLEQVEFASENDSTESAIPGEIEAGLRFREYERFGARDYGVEPQLQEILAVFRFGTPGEKGLRLSHKEVLNLRLLVSQPQVEFRIIPFEGHKKAATPNESKNRSWFRLF